MTMLPRLEAGETMEAALAVALGTGSLKKTEQRRTMEALRKKTKAPRTRPAKATAAMLGSVGIEVEVIKPNEAGDG